MKMIEVHKMEDAVEEAISAINGLLGNRVNPILRHHLQAALALLEIEQRRLAASPHHVPDTLDFCLKRED